MKTFRPWNIEQAMLLPPSVRDFVPEGHLSHFVRDTVSESLDLSAILDVYTEEPRHRHHRKPNNSSRSRPAGNTRPRVVTGTGS
jgi:hypothetical protein